jgi:hypothetical protein
LVANSRKTYKELLEGRRMGVEQCHTHPKILGAKNVGIARYPDQFWKRAKVSTALIQEKDI